MSGEVFHLSLIVKEMAEGRKGSPLLLPSPLVSEGSPGCKGVG